MRYLCMTFLYSRKSDVNHLSKRLNEQIILALSIPNPTLDLIPFLFGYVTNKVLKRESAAQEY